MLPPSRSSCAGLARARCNLRMSVRMYVCVCVSYNTCLVHIRDAPTVYYGEEERRPRQQQMFGPGCCCRAIQSDFRPVTETRFSDTPAVRSIIIFFFIIITIIRPSGSTHRQTKFDKQQIPERFKRFFRNLPTPYGGYILLHSPRHATVLFIT